ncbi:MAG: Uncharacterized protein XE11_0007 [Methanomicrobiales archaeon 53_19]|uniref:hypothetical protein n=1 Tax=Methanocalculus sp. TaxID=2004547 RepID=UPI0007471683|nr:hypothetical protein [Methanocalculus sp.]KUK71260.1 MAG: Uncharacterized protein XD88_0151 [Methanocalculus sp. 52_23]KUL05145.1 MAG: Uncharacterized protein XE11_0007 [Methanomicrobiales archaeon 53_19]HIJ05849.1 hypothetical protein [Methanocalculus sp.]
MKSRILIFLLLFSIFIGTASAIPPLPAEFYGGVTIDGIGAPPGTVITAKVDFNERGSFTLTEYGAYGETGIAGSRLIVQATEDDMASGNPIVTFWIDNLKADQEVPFESGTTKELDLTFSGTGDPDDQTPVASGESSFAPPGIQVSEVGNEQQITINLQETNAIVTTEGNNILMQNVGNGWEQIIVRTNGTPTDGAQSITGLVAGITATTTPLTASIDSTVGTAHSEIEIDLGRMPPSDAKISSTITKEPDANAQSGFILTAQQSGKGILDVAYVLNIQKTNVANAGDGGLIQSAKIRMVVSPAWVTAMGGVDRVVIMRRADDGSTTSLTTTMIGTNNVGDFIFEANSPGGLSSFALIGLSVPGGGGNSGGGGGSSSTPSSGFVYETQPVTPIPTEPVSSQAPVAEQTSEEVSPGLPEQTASPTQPAEPTPKTNLPVSPLIPIMALGLLYLVRRR